MAGSSQFCELGTNVAGITVKFIGAAWNGTPLPQNRWKYAELMKDEMKAMMN